MDQSIIAIDSATPFQFYREKVILGENEKDRTATGKITYLLLIAYTENWGSVIILCTSVSKRRNIYILETMSFSKLSHSSSPLWRIGTHYAT